jgi:hypothetical protein
MENKTYHLLELVAKVAEKEGESNVLIVILALQGSLASKDSGLLAKHVQEFVVSTLIPREAAIIEAQQLLNKQT